METQVKKWGNSLGLRLPKHIADQINLTEGNTVDISVVKDKIEIYVVKDKKARLREKLSRITEENKHEETQTGHSIGNER